MKQWLTIVFCLFSLMFVSAQQPADSLGCLSADSVGQVSADGATTAPIVYKAIAKGNDNDQGSSSRNFFYP
ncbi:MAG: hypothetical protein K5764_04420 [Prevotella sp.]|nr:hypothetical protein [Prevotella sp.]